LLPILLGTRSASGVLEPVFYDLFKKFRKALLFSPGSLVQLTLEVRGETPAIDLALHAPQCSACRMLCHLLRFRTGG
jgi:hypothetical protein